MSAARTLLDRLGRPGGVRLGTGGPERIARLSTGFPALDIVLDGGLPRDRVTEVAGRRSTGRTGLACAIAASATRAGETIGWIDPADSLDPFDAESAGVDLTRVLWIRPRSNADALRAAEIVLRAGGFGLVVLDLETRASARPEANVWSRLTRAAEQARSALLVITPERQAGTHAALGLELDQRRVRWRTGSGRLALLDGIETRVTVVRSRVGRAGQALVVRQACA